jgi:hypothetical protein
LFFVFVSSGDIYKLWRTLQLAILQKAAATVPRPATLGHFFQRIRESTHRQTEACVAVQGQYFEHLL